MKKDSEATKQAIREVVSGLQVMLTPVITDILWSIAKGIESPLSAESHLCRAVTNLLQLCPDEYDPRNPELQDALDFAKEHMRLLGKTNGQA